MHLFFLLYLLHSITLAIRLVAYANFKTQKKRAESSRLSSRPSRLHEKMQKGIEKSPTEIKRFVIFFFPVRLGSCDPKKNMPTCHNQCISPPHYTRHQIFVCVPISSVCSHRFWFKQRHPTSRECPNNGHCPHMPRHRPQRRKRLFLRVPVAPRPSQSQFTLKHSI